MVNFNHSTIVHRQWSDLSWDVLEVSWKCYLKTCRETCLIDVLGFPRHLETCLKTSWKCLETNIENVLRCPKMSWNVSGHFNIKALECLKIMDFQDILRRASRHLENVLRRILKMFWDVQRCHIKALELECLKTSWKFQRCLEDVSRRLGNPKRHLEDVSRHLDINVLEW